MHSLIFSFSLFCIAFLLHLIIWRFHIPKNPIRALLLIFYFILFSGLLFLWYYQIGSSLLLKNLLFEYLRVSLFFTALIFTYCFVYIGLIDDCPSLFTIMSIFNAGEKGLSKTELSHLINDDIFIKPRMEYMVEEKMIYKSRDRYKLEPKGYKLLSIFIFINKLMKMPLKPG